MEHWNSERAAKGLAEIACGIGLHVGEVMFGNIGCTDRLDFTVIGSAVNEVARIESLTRSLEVPMLMSRGFECRRRRGRCLARPPPAQGRSPIRPRCSRSAASPAADGGVHETGIEPVRPFYGPADFKSAASTNFATRARARRIPNPPGAHLDERRPRGGNLSPSAERPWPPGKRKTPRAAQENPARERAAHSPARRGATCAWRRAFALNTSRRESRRPRTPPT